MTRRLAVVLFNLGGPDSPEAVQPFLFNLFNDPAIIGAPGPIRWALAKFISKRRAPVAKAIYEEMGGRSPIVPLTQQQALALEKRLAGRGGWDEVKSFVVMRYWHPRAADVAKQVADYAPDQVVLLPLYPQYSTTTSGSSLKEWHEATAVAGMAAPSATVCCHPMENHFIEAHRELISDAIKQAGGPEGTRVLFSAHGLPKKIVDGGDPYEWQVEQTTQAVVKALAIPGLDWLNCYQSRVGPLEWIGPSTDDEILRAAAEGKKIVVVPIAFVSEHSETLVELDIEYRELAERAGAKAYIRVPALGPDENYMEGLAMVALEAAGREQGICPGGAENRICPRDFGRCALQKASQG